jgi:hypothetical protein
MNFAENLIKSNFSSRNRVLSAILKYQNRTHKKKICFVYFPMKNSEIGSLVSFPAYRISFEAS